MDNMQTDAVETAAGPANPRKGIAPAVSRLFGRLIPLVIAFGCVAGVLYVGKISNWRLPKFSSLIGVEAAVKEDWCLEHSVPDSECVECHKECLPRGKDNGWCRKHGVHDCLLEHPEIAQLPYVPSITDEDRARAERALAFTPRVENNSKCKLHERRIQFATEKVIEQLGIEVGAVAEGPMTEFIAAAGELGYDPTRVARLTSRVPGTVFSVEKRIGDKVRKGEVLALVDAMDVGKAKSEFQQALVQLDLKTLSVAKLRSSAGAVSERNLHEAEAAMEEAQVRLLTAEQSLANLGMPVLARDVEGLKPVELAARLQFLGLPKSITDQIAAKVVSSNLLPVIAPFDGEIVSRTAVAGEAADASKPLFILADARELWLTLRIRSEDVHRVKPGLEVLFRHEDESQPDSGKITWISPAADERMRTVAVRAKIDNADGRHRANTFGSAEIVLREEPKAVLVPSEAVHWEGDCHVVFVRDRNFGIAGSPKVFHVRKVRPGSSEMSILGPVTEIAAGVFPGEMIATTNSGILRTELLKNNLGAG